MCGAKFLTFHAGFYLGQDKEEVYKKIRDALEEVKEKLDSEDCKIMLRPELTGKETQFGNLQELVRLSKDLGILPCIDFAHMHARNGKHNSESEFRETLEYLEKELDCLKNMHIHMAGINYGEKGEKNHLMLEESDMRWKELLKVWKEFDIKGIVTCESPNIELDAIKMKKYYEGL
ncbi:TIM barrel protein, partial [Candidatus Woesearchaeota archaeon]|nr:TIM barrel protein [Candidatus Woesearchaeota archaeon]